MDADTDFVAVPDLWRLLTADTLPDLLARGAVESINLRYFDESGDLVPSELNKRVIGLTLGEIRAIPRMIGVTGGPSKYRAILVALKAHWVDALVTDHATAAMLLGSI